MPVGLILPTNARAAGGGAQATQVSGLDSGAGRSRDPGRRGRRAQRHLGRRARLQVLLLRRPGEAAFSPRSSRTFLFTSPFEKEKKNEGENQYNNFISLLTRGYVL